MSKAWQLRHRPTKRATRSPLLAGGGLWCDPCGLPLRTGWDKYIFKFLIKVGKIHLNMAHVSMKRHAGRFELNFVSIAAAMDPTRLDNAVRRLLSIQAPGDAR